MARMSARTKRVGSLDDAEEPEDEEGERAGVDAMAVEKREFRT
jgi:hypothetical protein